MTESDTMTKDPEVLAKENQELRERLSATEMLLQQQQEMLQSMKMQLQKLAVRDGPPTSPTSIIDQVSTCSSKSIGYRIPPTQLCRKASLSSQEQHFLSSVLEGCYQEETTARKLPSLVPVGAKLLSHDSSRRISSISIPDVSPPKNNPKLSNSSRKELRSRRPTPLPSTPERAGLMDDSDETESFSTSDTYLTESDLGSESESESESETETEGSDEPLNATCLFSAHSETTKNSNTSEVNDERSRQELPILIPIKGYNSSSSRQANEITLGGISTPEKSSEHASINPTRPLLTRRCTPVPSARTTNEDDRAESSSEISQSNGTPPSSNYDTMSDEYLVAAMSQLASSDLPPRSTLRARGCRRRGRRPNHILNKTEASPTTEGSSPSTLQHNHKPAPSKRAFEKAVKGFPREHSLELHSDDDITVYPSPPKEFARTIEVFKHQVLDVNCARGLYTGSIDYKSHLPDGYGTMLYREGQKYTGDWEKGRWHGHGTLTMKSGDIYIGHFSKHEKHGQGRVEFADGRVFEGRFHFDDMREGKLTFTDDSYYEGLMKNGRRQDFGMYVFTDGSYYQGQWNNDQMHGWGRIEWCDGSSYNGNWHLGVQHGIGTETDRDGTITNQGQYYYGQPVYTAESDT